MDNTPPPTDASPPLSEPSLSEQTLPTFPALPTSLRGESSPLKLGFHKGILLGFPQRLTDILGWKANYELDYIVSAGHPTIPEGRTLTLMLREHIPSERKSGRPRADGLVPGSPEALLANAEKEREYQKRAKQRQREAVRALRNGQTSTTSSGAQTTTIYADLTTRPQRRPQRPAPQPVHPPKRALSSDPETQALQMRVWSQGGPAADDTRSEAPPRLISSTTARMSIPGKAVTYGEIMKKKAAEKAAVSLGDLSDLSQISEGEDVVDEDRLSDEDRLKARRQFEAGRALYRQQQVDAAATKNAEETVRQAEQEALMHHLATLPRTHPVIVSDNPITDEILRELAEEKARTVAKVGGVVEGKY